MTAHRVQLAAAVFVGAVGVGYLTASLVDDEPQPTRATNFISSEVLVDATVIEMHGYGPDGEPGTFTYDCAMENGKLVCTQREEP